ncbi:Y-family DNA polymerase [Chitinophaga sp. NPDC101104]|uniref:Y-family DNA polymerase n=1 Tax=Chitinophaga sp. NPDC101104 TaxID=3390561 RepID=UPI003D0850E2
MIALVDCNNFYVSCERLFHPAVLHRPVVVLSNNDGCVISRSEEAKALGIRMGAPAFFMEDLLERNQVAVFSSNYTLYGSLSQRVMQVLAGFVPEMEVYSIDEAFLDITGHASPATLAAAIRTGVLHNVGMPVSVGVAPTKTLAKMANRAVKKSRLPEGFLVLDYPGKTTAVLAATQVEDIWGIGSQYAAMLHQKGVHTALDLSRVPDDFARRELTVQGLRLVHELRGIPSIGMEESAPAKKAVCVARSFGQLLTEKDDIREALANYAAVAAQKLRAQGSRASIIQVFVQTNNFRGQDAQYHRSVNVRLPVPASSTRELIRQALLALDRIFKPGYNYKKTGIVAMDLVPDSQVQENLFESTDHEKERKLMQALDGITRHFAGKPVLRFAVQGGDKKWALRQERLSPCYTTRLEEIIKAKAE